MKIKIRSDIEQIKQTSNTCCFFKPCSMTNIFCAPIANIKLNPEKKPSMRNSIKKLKFFYNQRSLSFKFNN